MDPILGGSLVSAGTGLLNNIFGNAAQKKADKRNFQYSMKMAEFQNQKNVEMWNMQNQYNSPAQQMLRLNEAGLNPNLVYGNGSVTGNTSSHIPEYQAPKPDFHSTPFQLPNVLSVLSAFQDLQIKKSQTQSIEADVTEKNIKNQFLENFLVNRNSKLDAETNRALVEMGAEKYDDGTWSRNKYGYHTYRTETPFSVRYQNTIKESLWRQNNMKSKDSLNEIMYKLLSSKEKGQDLLNQMTENDLEWYNSLNLGKDSSNILMKILGAVLGGAGRFMGK